MSELEAAIREHLELKRRRFDDRSEPPPAAVDVAVATPAAPEAPGREQPAASSRIVAGPATGNGSNGRAEAPAPPRFAVGDGSNGRAAAPASTRAAPATAGPDLGSVEEPFGLIPSAELVARRAAARSRAQRTKRARRGIALVALAGLLAVSVPTLARVLPGKHDGRGHGGIRAAGGSHRAVRVSVPATYAFARSSAVRSPVTADKLEAFWNDGLPCSVGCRARGVVAGWPLEPFHGQHALRAGLNEQRATSFHHGIDIQAYDGSPVYAIQSGQAHIIQATGDDSRVQVGNFIYWHIRPTVREGQRVAPYRQIVGRITAGHGHLHFSEVDAAGRYLNPLRPGGRALEPWGDSQAPVLDRPRLAPTGEVIIRAFDPQSFRLKTTYETPIMAPAAVAYRIFDPRGSRLGPLHWALRGSQNLQWTPERAAAIYASGSSPVHASCFEHQAVCRPDYIYVLAGGLAPALTGLNLPAGRYRLAAYAWDWTGNAAARDAWFTVRSDGTVAG